MDEIHTRTVSLIGTENLAKLQKAHIAVFGLGGVGGYAVECLARSGIGFLDICDNDTVSLSNINRQIIALHSTVGLSKIQVAQNRITDINPSITVHTDNRFFLPENADDFDFSIYDYIIDAVDTVSAKIAIVLKAAECGTPVISCMGTGNKRNPALLQIADISQTSVCPLARIMRRELKKRGITKLKTVYSTELPEYVQQITNPSGSAESGRHPPASMCFVPAAAGILLAAEVVRDIIGEQ